MDRSGGGGGFPGISDPGPGDGPGPGSGPIADTSDPGFYVDNAIKGPEIALPAKRTNTLVWWGLGGLLVLGAGLAWWSSR